MVEIVKGFEGRIVFDESKPEGVPKKLMDTTLLNSFGWTHRFDLESGLKKA